VKHPDPNQAVEQVLDRQGRLQHGHDPAHHSEQGRRHLPQNRLGVQERDQIQSHDHQQYPQDEARLTPITPGDGYEGHDGGNAGSA
jgi:hypothetical protein